jgi:hypothetical protein
MSTLVLARLDLVVKKITTIALLIDNYLIMALSDEKSYFDFVLPFSPKKPFLDAFFTVLVKSYFFKLKAIFMCLILCRVHTQSIHLFSSQI